MDVTTFRFLISLVVIEKLNMCLMDVVIAYGQLDNDIYMKIPKLYIPEHIYIEIPKLYKMLEAYN